MAEEVTLPPCPFCGGNAEVHSTLPAPLDDGPESYWTECWSCGAGFLPVSERGEAVAAWKRRTALATAEADIAALRGEVERLREVDRLAGIASRWHWFGDGAVDDYEDSDDLFQDLDNARGKALEASRARQALTDGARDA